MKNHIKQTVLLLTFTACVGLVQAQPEDQSSALNESENIDILTNVEFMGFIYHLAWIGPGLEQSSDSINIKGNRVSEKEYRAYGYEIYRRYKSHSNNSHLQEIINTTQNIGYTPLIDLILSIDDFPNATLNENISESVYKAFSASGDVEEGKKMVSEFLQTLNKLYREVDFPAYLQESDHYYKKAKKEVSDAILGSGIIPAMENFYRVEFQKYYMIPSLLLPSGMGFGPRKKVNGGFEVYNIFGPLDVQNLDEGSLKLGFQDFEAIRELAIHEFGHSFVNPELAALQDSLYERTEFLFEEIKESMYEQGYHNWESCVIEHFVRAGEIVLASQLGEEKSAYALKKEYIENRDYIYIPVIIDEMNAYKKGRYSNYREMAESALRKLSNYKSH